MAKLEDPLDVIVYLWLASVVLAFGIGLMVGWLIYG